MMFSAFFVVVENVAVGKLQGKEWEKEVQILMSSEYVVCLHKFEKILSFNSVPRGFVMNIDVVRIYFLSIAIQDVHSQLFFFLL